MAKAKKYTEDDVMFDEDNVNFAVQEIAIAISEINDRLFTPTKQDVIDEHELARALHNTTVQAAVALAIREERCA